MQNHCNRSFGCWPLQMPATRVAGHITSCLRKMELVAEKEAKAKRIAEEAEIARCTCICHVSITTDNRSQFIHTMAISAGSDEVTRQRDLLFLLLSRPPLLARLVRRLSSCQRCVLQSVTAESH